jgi:hypothetical protein
VKTGASTVKARDTDSIIVIYISPRCLQTRYEIDILTRTLGKGSFVKSKINNVHEIGSHTGTCNVWVIEYDEYLVWTVFT